ncbi:porin [Mongoliimonas terrestris]|uniref:porin n=1 Tax=Mongoliimonas terrestris TaxID=1709001 RepID=UPI00094986BC|nr:porin [Mongoliimonas terrestris]
MGIKSVLLGTVAGLVAVTGAQAADLPGEAVPAAVDYVKVCDTFGTGFFYIPGTETCLDISGRVRFRMTAYESGVDNDFTVQFRADARVDFDARTMTEYGQLRSFFRLATNSSDGIQVEGAFIQLGYLTAGLAGDLYNADVLYGVNDFVVPQHDEAVQLTVLVDGIGGGFYAGASILSAADRDLRDEFYDDYLPELQAAIGIAKQPWGSFDLSLQYIPEEERVAGSDDRFSVKATADLTLVENLKARLTAAYFSDDPGTFRRGFAADGDETFLLSGALAYTVGNGVALYAGLRYDMQDESDDDIYANIGVDYTVTSGLVLTGEIAYSDVDDDDDLQGVLQLSRTW